MRSLSGNDIATSLLATALGVGAGLSVSAVAWGDTPAPVLWVVSSSLVAVVSLFGRAPISAMTVYLATACVAMFLSSAAGSSFAGATWWPVLLAAIAVGRLSSRFTLALTATVLVRDAGTIVVLNQVLGGAATSGSVQYFLGFIGVVAVPLWFCEAIRVRAGSVALLATFTATAIVALGVWAVLASSSRAAGLGLAAVILAGALARLMVRERTNVRWKRVFAVLGTIAVLVPAIDAGLGYVFGSGAPIVATNVAGQIDLTVTEIEAEGRMLGGVRLPLWRQATEAMFAEPLGHGPASYGHVNHAYQNEPLLWSGSPHSVWFLTAVELGVPGVLALMALVVGGIYAAARRGSPAMPALLGATAVMSIDVIASMPVQSLIWWTVIGAAWGPAGGAKGLRGALSVGLVIVFLIIGNYSSWRLASPCGEGCDPIRRYGGHPRFTGTTAIVIGDDPEDPRWSTWRSRYPLAFWLAYAEAEARMQFDPTATLDLLRAYPYQSAERYVEVADTLSDTAIASDIAVCGLIRFFDGRAILRDWRSSAAELDAVQQALEERASGVVVHEDACVRAQIPTVAIGMQ